jgi:drug/metabolite transporter (DMT)-like permease
MTISSKSLLLLILVSVTCSSLAQLLLKMGMVNNVYAQAAAAGDWRGMAQGALLNPFVVGGLSLYFASTLVWLSVLARVDLSYAYPFVGLGFLLTLFFGWAVMKEDVTLPRVIGTLMIAGGVVLVGSTRGAS